MSWSFATRWKSGERVWTLDNSSLPPVDDEPVVQDCIAIPDVNDVPPPPSPSPSAPEASGNVVEMEVGEEWEWETIPNYYKGARVHKKKGKKEESDEDDDEDDKPKVAGSAAGAEPRVKAKATKASKAEKAVGSATSKKRKAADDDDDDDENLLPAEAMVKTETTSRYGRVSSRPQRFSR